METILLVVVVGVLNLIGGFYLGTWYCKNVKGMKQ